MASLVTGPYTIAFFFKSRAYATVTDSLDVLKQQIVDGCRTICQEFPNNVVLLSDKIDMTIWDNLIPFK